MDYGIKEIIFRLISYAEQLGVNSFKIAFNPDRAVTLTIGDVNVEVKVDNVSENSSELWIPADHFLFINYPPRQGCYKLFERYTQ
jgi:hypothetical protein